jgi:MraZ protein
MAMFIGVYDLKADSKGRFVFPSSLRKQLSSESSELFVMKRSVFYKCIELFPQSTWTKETEAIARLNRFVKKNNDFIRLFMSGSRIVNIDDGGRLLIPKDLMVFSGITKDIVLASAIDRLEIWSKSEYEAFIAGNSADFSTLAESVMGNAASSQEEI